jgi:hypothetical protein
MCWTPIMSLFVLCHFVDLVGEGVKTDKGFKEVHLNMVVSVCHFLFYYSVLFLFVSLHVCRLSYFSSSRLSNPLFLDISILLDSYHVHILLQVIQKVGS